MPRSVTLLSNLARRRLIPSASALRPLRVETLAPVSTSIQMFLDSYKGWVDNAIKERQNEIAAGKESLPPDGNTQKAP